MAVGEVSENPSASAVTRPTVPETRDQDIDRKLRLYGIFHAFSNGKFPSNKQIDRALTSAVDSNSLQIPNKELSEEGRQLVQDLRDVIDSMKQLWLKKNYDENLQNFLYHTVQASSAPDSTNINAPVSKDQAQQHGQDALQGLRTLGRLLVTNGQFRKLLEDSTLLIRDMMADGAAKATQKIRPDQDRLAKIDEPAQDHTWHEAPPSIGQMKDNLTSKVKGAQSQAGDGQNRAQQEGRGVMEDASRAATGQEDPQEAGRRAADENVNQTCRSDVDQTSGLSGGLQSAKDRIADRIPEEHKDEARQFHEANKQQAKDYFSNKIPQERRDKAIFRLKKMVVEIQQHEDYSDAVDTLISLAEEYVHHAKTVAKDTHHEARRSTNDSNVQKAQAELKTLLENFADGTSMDDMFDAADDLIADANDDEEFNKWGKRLDTFIRKCLKEDGYILKDQSTNEWNEIVDQGQYFLNDRYKEHTDRLNDEVNRWFGYMANDPDSVAFGDKVQKLFLDLGQDNEGNVKFKPHLLKDVTNVIIPGIFENIRYVPIPRIEVSDPKVDAVVENLVVESENLMPNIFEIQADTFWRFGRKKIYNKSTHRLSVHVSQIQCDLKDVAYWIKKKQGFPSITDQGVMDIFMGGHGLSFDMKLVTADSKDRNRFFKVENVNVKVQNLNVVLKKSNHKTLFNFFKPLLMGVVKPAVAKAAEIQIRRSFDQLDEQLWLVQQEYNKAKEAAKNQPPEETANMLSMYVQAIEKRITEIKEGAQKRASVTKVNVANTKETSMFPNVHLESGISTKATKYRQMAREGEEWRSPIFDMGSADASTKISEPKKITRKSPHQHSRATINEGPTRKGGINDPEVAYMSLHSGGADGAQKSSAIGAGGNGYQARMSTAADSMRTAVDQDDFEGTHVGKYNVTGSVLPQEPITVPRAAQ